MEVNANWSDKDFEIMGWHDSYIHSISFPPDNLQLIMDIDYIFEWELKEEEGTYDFWVSPCKLVFHDVLFFKLNLDFSNSTGLEIVEITRSNPRPYTAGDSIKWDYFIETNMGKITFQSSGYSMSVINQPVLSKGQILNRQY